MSKIAPVRPQKESLLTRAAAVTETPVNLSKQEATGYKGFVDLNFKVEPDFHYEFRMMAAKHRLSMKELMLACYKAWKDQHEI